MTFESIIETMEKNSLTVRCLPHVVINNWSYRKGDEERIKKPHYYSNGKVINSKRSIIFNKSWNRKLVREERQVEKGGWWYVKETRHTDSTVRFNRKTDKFFAPTLEEAIKLYLEDKKGRD